MFVSFTVSPTVPRSVLEPVVRVKASGRGSQGCTVVVAVAELLLVFGSACCALTVAVLVIVPFAVGFTRMVTVALPPFAMLPRLHTTIRLVGFNLHVP